MKDRIWLAIGLAFLAWMIIGGIFLGTSEHEPREDDYDVRQGN